jgi:hypothetical protein
LPFGPKTSVFKVAGKMLPSPSSARTRFGSASSASPSSPRRCAGRTRRCFPDTTSTRRHWNTVIIDGSLPEQMIKDMIGDSYDLVVSQLPEPGHRELGWTTDERPAQARRGPAITVRVADQASAVARTSLLRWTRRRIAGGGAARLLTAHCDHMRADTHVHSDSAPRFTPRGERLLAFQISFPLRFPRGSGLARRAVCAVFCSG